MASFYGKVSSSNRSAFTFDRIYPSRYVMDTSCAEDGIFIGRYILVEYDDPPIQGYFKDGSFYLDAECTTQISNPAEDRIYQALNKLNTQYPFYVYNRSYNRFEEYQFSNNIVSNYAYYYQQDIVHYGRGYDSTVWMKTVDTSTGKYKYIMVAELNTIIPNFHLVAERPSASALAPFFDKNSTNLDYYLHMPVAFGHRINVASSSRSDVDVTYTEAVWDENNQNYIYVQRTNQPGDIFFNRAGFNKFVRKHIDSTYDGTGDPNTKLDSINYIMGRSGRKYGGTNGVAGVAQDDEYRWYIYLPSIGNAICEVWDTVYGQPSTANGTRKTQILDETGVNRYDIVLSSADNSAMVDTDSVIGVTNSTRAMIGIIYAAANSSQGSPYETLTPVVSGDYLPNRVQSKYHTSILYMDREENSVWARDYYYPVYTNTWQANANGDYYYDSIEHAYKPANKSALPANTQYYSRDGGTDAAPLLTYKKAYSRDKSESVTGGLNAIAADLGLHGIMPNTIYGAIAYINRIIGSGLKQEDSRDDRTVIGLMNRMKDMIYNIDRQLSPSKWIITDANGIMTTSTVVYNDPSGGTNYERILGNTGTWQSRFAEINVTAASSNNVTELTTASGAVTSVVDTGANSTIDSRVNFATGNKWIRLAINNTTKLITWAHALCGIAAATLTPTATGWGTEQNNNDNILTIPTITFDEAGHITGHSTVSFYLPHSFKTFSIAEQSSAVTNSTGNTNSIVADNSADTFIFATANKWLTIAATENTDTLTFGHIISGVTAGSYGLSADVDIATLDTDNRFNVPYFTVDEAGHITVARTHTVALPEGFVTFKAQNNLTTVTEIDSVNGSMTASSLTDTFMFEGGNKWIMLKINNVENTQKTLTFGHSLNGALGAQTEIGKNTGNQLTPAYAGTFVIPYITIDEAGHVTGLTTSTITLPSISLTNGSGNVVTALSLNTTTGAFTETRANVGTLAITGYAIASSAAALAATDTINEAFGKLEKRIKTVEDDYLVANDLSPYLTSQDAANTYLTQTDASTTYLTQTDASTTYLTQTDAGTTYLTQTDASTIYLTQLDAETTYLSSEEAATTYQAIEDSADPYAVESYVDQAVADAIAAIGRNYQLTLIPPTVTAVYNNGVIASTVNEFDGAGTIWLEKFEDSNWITVSESAQAVNDDMEDYIIEENGTYRTAVRRQYNGSNVIGYSESIIVDDIIPPEPTEPTEPEEPGEQEPEPDPENPGGGE